MRDVLPDVFTSLSKYHTIKDHYTVLKSISCDSPESKIPARQNNPHVFATARRYLLIRNGVVIRDRLIDFIHSEQEFTQDVKMVMYFLFMFRDARCRGFICSDVAMPNGKWNVAVFRAMHTSFFKQAGGHKAFTNLRRLLFDIGVLDENTFQVKMGDLQHWLPIAARIAAEHLNPESQAKLVSSPHGFLIRNKLNAIVNCTPEELAEIAIGGSYEEATDLLPQIELPTSGPRRSHISALKSWGRRPPGKREQRTYNYSSDSVAFERANYQHWLLEKLTAEALAHSRAQILTSELIDMVVLRDQLAILFEMKSCNANSMRQQVRRGISQLFEYQFLHRDALPQKTYLCLVLERKPTGSVKWMLEYTESLGIGTIWKADDRDELVCSPRAEHLLRKMGRIHGIRIDK